MSTSSTSLRSQHIGIANGSVIVVDNAAMSDSDSWHTNSHQDQVSQSESKRVPPQPFERISDSNATNTMINDTIDTPTVLCSPLALSMIRGTLSQDSLEDEKDRLHLNHHDHGPQQEQRQQMQHFSSMSHITTSYQTETIVWNNKSNKQSRRVGSMTQRENFKFLKNAVHSCLPLDISTATNIPNNNYKSVGEDREKDIVTMIPTEPCAQHIGQPSGETNRNGLSQLKQREHTQLYTSRSKEDHTVDHTNGLIQMQTNQQKEILNQELSSLSLVTETKHTRSQHESISSEALVAMSFAGHQHYQHHQQNYGEIRNCEEDTHTFPGFSLYTKALVYFLLGNYTKALDITTECLAFQKKALAFHCDIGTESDAGKTTTGITLTPGTGIMDGSVNTYKLGIGATVGNSIRNLLKTGSVHSSPSSNDKNVTPKTSSTMESSFIIPTAQHPIVIANSIMKMLSHYPYHSCVAQTLLLRGRVLAVCGMYRYGSFDTGNDHDDENGRRGRKIHLHSNETIDYSLLHQAVQHIEMAVAMQRKLSTKWSINRDLTQWELATPIELLGVLKTQMRKYEEADSAYEEALLILQSAAQWRKEGLLDLKDMGEAKKVKQHIKALNRINREIAHVMQLRGRCFQCRKKYREAFHCYHNSLHLLSRRSSLGKDTLFSHHDLSMTKMIIHFMQRGSAVEKLLSDYWNDPHGI